MPTPAKIPAAGRIGIYMIGGRDGESPLPFGPVLEDDAFHVFFDADEAAVPQMLARNDPARSRVFPYCLAETNGTGTFYHNYDPYTSSLLKPAAEFDLWQLHSHSMFYRHADTLRTMRETPMELRTLDSLHLLDDPQVAAPTVIALDTQGTELSILRGGRELVTEHTMAIVTEAEFMPFYEGQPLFGDVCAALAEFGFVLADFWDGPFRVDPYSAPLGLRSRPMLGFCDALFLRKPATIAKDPLHLAQLAFVAQLFGQLGFGFHCLDRLKNVDARLNAVPAERTYRAFLLELDAARQTMPIVYEPSFTDIFPTYEKSTERFNPAIPVAQHTANWAEQYAKVRTRLLRQQSELQALLSFEDTAVEAVLRKFSLDQHAQTCKDRRIANTTAMLTEFGLNVVR